MVINAPTALCHRESVPSACCAAHLEQQDWAGMTKEVFNCVGLCFRAQCGAEALGDV